MVETGPTLCPTETHAGFIKHVGLNFVCVCVFFSFLTNQKESKVNYLLYESLCMGERKKEDDTLR